MGGVREPYRGVPWFWSARYDLNLQYAGAGLPWDEVVVRGRLGRPPFTGFYRRGGELVAAAGVNDHHTGARARRGSGGRGPGRGAPPGDSGLSPRRAPSPRCGPGLVVLRRRGAA